MTVQTLEGNRGIIRDAFDQGREVKIIAPGRAVVVTDCLAPTRIPLEGVHGGELGTEYPDVRHGKNLLIVAIDARCKKCAPCLRARSNSWAYRTRVEIMEAQRTWFVTLTLSPDWQEHYGLLAISQCGRDGRDFEHLSEAEEFGYRNRVISKQVTLFIDRLRKRSKTKMRYIAVTEAHKTGLPHYHLLVMEQMGQPAILYRHFGFSKKDRDQHGSSCCWGLGHSTASLVTDSIRVPWYVCKYLSKNNLARVRASALFGRRPIQKTVSNQSDNVKKNNIDHKLSKLTVLEGMV